MQHTTRRGHGSDGCCCTPCPAVCAAVWATAGPEESSRGASGRVLAAATLTGWRGIATDHLWQKLSEADLVQLLAADQKYTELCTLVNTCLDTNQSTQTKPRRSLHVFCGTLVPLPCHRQSFSLFVRLFLWSPGLPRAPAHQKNSRGPIPLSFFLSVCWCLGTQKACRDGQVHYR